MARVVKGKATTKKLVSHGGTKNTEKSKKLGIKSFSL